MSLDGQLTLTDAERQRLTELEQLATDLATSRSYERLDLVTRAQQLTGLTTRLTGRDLTKDQP